MPRWRNKLARDLPQGIKRLRGIDNEVIEEGDGDDDNTDDAGFTRAVHNRDQGTAFITKPKGNNAVSS